MTNRASLPFNYMKIVFLAALILMSGSIVAAQPADILKSFEQNKAKYTREHFASGEDASSGYDYLYYKDRANKIVKVRSIWSASHSNELRVEDSYFDGESLILLRRSTGPEKQLSALKRGKNLPLTLKDELYFKDSKLISFTEDRKAVPNTDPRWKETESSLADHAKAMLENYQWLKEDK